ncbi:paired amphipathic helix protein Sin3-like 4 [Carica papaya]|uniref:paired amphipathic helix protein Sin3-like 4 n=1 Tax=Carica papaya TaxID=3649 RepID=UPI000B8CA774|nr:paired amphipathic helix protein Sin3-like 4 [Carica papaya]
MDRRREDVGDLDVAQARMREAIAFVNKIKRSFAKDVRRYMSFLDLMMMYEAGAKTIRQVYADLAVIFAEHDDLMQEFNAMILDSASGEDGETGEGSYFDDYTKAKDFFKKVKAELRNPHKYSTFLNLFNLYAEQRIHKPDLLKLSADLIGDGPLLDELKIFLEFLDKETSKGNESSTRRLEKIDKETNNDGCREQEKNADKSVAELDLFKCKQITPSYRLIPKEHQIPASIHRTELGNQVLNDQLKCVSKDEFAETSEKNKPRTGSPTEEAMFVREGEMYETDMLVSTITAAIAHGEQILKETEQGNEIKREPPLRFFSLIEKMYGDSGMDAVDFFHGDPTGALARFIPRFKQKLEELLNFRSKQRIFM